MKRDELKNIIRETIIQTVPALMGTRKIDRGINYYKLTEARLYGYSTLKYNVEYVYPADIADLKAEGVSERSKSIVIFSASGGEKITPKENQERRIMLLELKAGNDKKEIAEIDKALDYIQRESYCGCIEQYYILGRRLDDIAADYNLQPAEMGRVKSRLVRQISLRLYGALALEG